MIKHMILAGAATFSSLAVSATYQKDNSVEKKEGCEQPDEGVVCVKYSNQDYAHKLCRIKASVKYTDAMSGQKKKVVGHNFTHLPAFADAKVCFDFSEQLAVFNPWSEEEIDASWVAGKYEGSVECRTLENQPSEDSEEEDEASETEGTDPE